MSITKLTKALTGYKKVYTKDGRSVVLTLEIPRGASIHRVDSPKHPDFCSSGNRDKLRASSAKVISAQIYFWDGVTHTYKPEEEKTRKRIFRSIHHEKFLYKIGEIARPTKPFCHKDLVCASGIHFFLTKYDAIHY